MYKINELDLKSRTVSRLAKAGVEEASMADLSDLLEIKGIGPATVQEISLAIQDLEEGGSEADIDEEGTDEGDNAPASDKPLIIEHRAGIDKCRVLCMYENLSYGGETQIGTLLVKLDGGTRFNVHISYKDGELVYESSEEGDLNEEQWELIKSVVLAEYKIFKDNQSKEDDEFMEDLASGEELVWAVEHGVKSADVLEVYYKSSLDDGDLVADIRLVLMGGTQVKGEAKYFDGELKVNYFVGDEAVEVPKEVTEKLIGKVRAQYAVKAKHAHLKEATTIEASKQDNNTTDKSDKQELTMKRVSGKLYVVAVDGKKLNKAVLFSEYNKQEEGAPEEDARQYGLDDYKIKLTRTDLDGLANGTVIAECKLVAANKEATFMAVFYDGSLRYFEKGGNRNIKMETTRDFLTDKIREAYVSN